CCAAILRYIPFLFSPLRPTTETFTLSLHDALPIFELLEDETDPLAAQLGQLRLAAAHRGTGDEHVAVGRLVEPGGKLEECALARSEEHTSELQSLTNLVCRLLLEKKNHPQPHPTHH